MIDNLKIKIKINVSTLQNLLQYIRYILSIKKREKIRNKKKKEREREREREIVSETYRDHYGQCTLRN